MKFCVIGEPCIDYIHRKGLENKKRFGGIMYSLISLAVIAKEHEIVPVFIAGTDEYENIISFLKSFKNINTEYIKITNRSTRVVNLYYTDQMTAGECTSFGHSVTYDRYETSTQPAEQIEYSLIENAFLSASGILINMVSGIDISLDTLFLIRKNFCGYIHLDLHNVVMKTNPDGTRTRDKVDNWKEWCTNSDSVQMNEAEINSLTGKKNNEYLIAETILAEDITGYPKTLIVTRGLRGVSLYQKKNKSNSEITYTEIDRVDLPALERNDFIDSTGCGDVFGAAFFYKSVSPNFKSFRTSLNYANKTASQKTALTGAEELYKLIG